MNKIIDKNHVCTFCDSTAKPKMRGDFLHCPTCGMPQFEGVIYDPDDDVAILDAEIIEGDRIWRRSKGNMNGDIKAETLKRQRAIDKFFNPSTARNHSFGY